MNDWDDDEDLGPSKSELKRQVRELQDLIDGLPRVIHARVHPPIRVRLLGLKSLWQQRKRYRHGRRGRRSW